MPAFFSPISLRVSSALLAGAVAEVVLWTSDWFDMVGVARGVLTKTTPPKKTKTFIGKDTLKSGP